MSLPLHLAIGAFDGVHLGHRAAQQRGQRHQVAVEQRAAELGFCLREVAYCASISTVKRSVNSVRRLIE